MLERVLRAIGVHEAGDPVLLAAFLGRALAPARVKTLTAVATLESDDFVVLCNAGGGAFAVNLPLAAVVARHVYVIKRTSAANNVTITPNGAETIDGAATLVLNAQNQSRIIFSDGANWSVLGGYL